MRVKLKELGEVITGNTPSKMILDYWDSDDVSFVKPDIISDSGITTIVESSEYLSEKAREKARIVSENAIFVTCIGSIGKIGIAGPGYYAFNQQINVIVPNENVVPKYLAYAMLHSKPQLTAIANAPVVPIINKSQFSDFEINIDTDMQKQVEIVNVLDKVVGIIQARENELSKLDDLVKARFVELFGDPITNPYSWNKLELKELADLKIGPFGSLLHKEDYIEGGHALVNPSHIVDGRIIIDPKLTVSEEKYAELSAYHLKVGDVVMGRRGEMGRCAVVEEEGLLCGTGSLLIRPKGKVTADYIQKIISYPTFKKTIEDMAVGQTMPNLNVPIVSGFRIITPPIEVQNSYYDFVAQVDKSKFDKHDIFIRTKPI